MLINYNPLPPAANERYLYTRQLLQKTSLPSIVIKVTWAGQLDYKIDIEMGIWPI